MNTLIQNVNTILDTKKRLGDIIRNEHKPVPDKFDQYPDKIEEVFEDANDLIENILG